MLIPLALFLALGCVPRSPGLALEPMVITGSPALADVSGLTNAEILAAAADRRLRGDIAGALARIAVVLEQRPAPPEAPDALYQQGLCFEREERFAEALAAYDAIVRDWPEAPTARDAWFRRALCLEYLGRHREARRSLARVDAAEGLDLHDRLTLDLQRGISLVRSGRERAGVRLLGEALAAAEGGEEATYLRAKAHVTLARVWLDEAAGIAIEGRDRAMTAALEERARCLAAAEKEVAAAAYLGEPEWILEGLLLLGDAFLALHDALLASTRPRGLGPEALEIYDAALADRAGVLLLKAWNHYDAGVSKAGEWRYEGRPLPSLVAARDAIDLIGIARPEAPPPPEAQGGGESSPATSEEP